LHAYSFNPFQGSDDNDYYYSRIRAPGNVRFEAALSAVLQADAITYPSGLSAVHAALILLNPGRVSIREDFYFGCHGVLNIVSRMSGLRTLPLECSAEDLQTGDLILLETPLSPSGEVFNISEYASKAHSRGAYLLVSSTLAPPGLQDPFQWGADLVIHSGSKYIGGHGDALCGVLATKNEAWVIQLRQDRALLGNVLGNLESWLGLRSLRTLEIRVQRQSQSTEKLVRWLDESTREDRANDSLTVQAVVERVQHTSLQVTELPWLRQQMPNGFGSVFSLTMKTERLARRLPSRLGLFVHATSFGGVESSVEWRRMSDRLVDARLVRVSIGLEDWLDLREDLLSAFRQLAED
jgi:cystathionine beta-lyase/cystathionine gamma-synthase